MSQVTMNHNFIHHAPRKLRLIADMIRGLPASEAVAELSTLTQGAAVIIRKTVMATMAAAKQQGLDEGQLFVRAILVDEGPKLRRFIPKSRGRSQGILKRMSHLRVTLSDEAVVIASSKAYKRELAATTQKANQKIERPTTEELATNPIPTSEVPANATIHEGSK